MPYQYTEADKQAIKRNPLNRGSCSYLAAVVYNLEKQYESCLRIRATTQKERDLKQRTVAVAYENYMNKKAILDMYHEIFPDEFNKITLPIKNPD